jgi:uncharacterized RDD family membrane protein YckC
VGRQEADLRRQTGPHGRDQGRVLTQPGGTAEPVPGHAAGIDTGVTAGIDTGVGAGTGTGVTAGIDTAADRPQPQARYDKGQLAIWPLRVVSGLVDQAIIGAPAWVPYQVLGSGHRRALFIANGGWVALGLLVLVAYGESRTGRSPGKALYRLRLVREETGQPLGFGAAVGRRFAHVLDVLSCYLGCLWPLWDAKRQTFADKCVGSVVLVGAR